MRRNTKVSSETATAEPVLSPQQARLQLSSAFLSVLTTDFLGHGADVLKAVRERDPARYTEIVARLVPRDLNISVEGGIHHAHQHIVETGEGLKATARFLQEMAEERNSKLIDVTADDAEIDDDTELTQERVAIALVPDDA